MKKTEGTLLLTVANELYLPSRLVYIVKDEAKFKERLSTLKCFDWVEHERRWTWLYEEEACLLDFPVEYKSLPPEAQPVVLASCRMAPNGRFHVYLRATIRILKFIEFFDRFMSKDLAAGEFLDEYNFLTRIRFGKETPPSPEDFFKEERNFVLIDAEALMRKSPQEYLRKLETDTLRKFDRHKFDDFVADGPRLMEAAMTYRETMAMLQDKSDKPIRPNEITRAVLGGKKPPCLG